MMKKVYVLVEESGSYSDYSHSNLLASLTQDDPKLVDHAVALDKKQPGWEAVVDRLWKAHMATLTKKKGRVSPMTRNSSTGRS